MLLLTENKILLCYFRFTIIVFDGLTFFSFQEKYSRKRKERMMGNFKLMRILVQESNCYKLKCTTVKPLMSDYPPGCHLRASVHSRELT